MHTKEPVTMRAIRNDKKKLICRLDEKRKIVEIVQKGNITIIHFKPNGIVEIIGGK